MNTMIKKLIEEVSYKSDIVHHTSISSLISILRSGYILPYKYVVSAKSDYKKYEPFEVSEIAVLRRSVDRYLKNIKGRNHLEYMRKMKYLTGNAKGVKIYLFSNNILSSVRGVKRKPIAEITRMNLSDYERYLDEVYKVLKKQNEDLTSKKLDTIINKYSRKIGEKLERKDEKFLAKLSDTDKNFEEEYGRIAYELGISLPTEEKRDYFISYVFALLRQAIYINFNLHSSREGEERFIFEKGSEKGIPLDKKFLKIRFEKEPNEKELYIAYSHYIGETAIKNIEEFKSNIIKYKDCFLIDENFNTFMKQIDKLIEYKKREMKGGAKNDK